MALKRMDNVGIVVEDLGGTIDFFRELGLELEGQATIEGEWAGRVTGLGDQHVEIAMMRTPDGHSRLELSRFLTPPVVADHRNAPVNALGYLRVMFAVDDIDNTLARLRKHGGSSYRRTRNNPHRGSEYAHGVSSSHGAGVRDLHIRTVRGRARERAVIRRCLVAVRDVDQRAAGQHDAAAPPRRSQRGTVR